MSATLLALLPGNPSPTRGSASKIAYHAPTDRIAYPQGRTVILRSLSPLSSSSSPSSSTAASGAGGLKFALPGSLTYAQHAHPVTLARFSPSGFYCASADTSGTVRIWDVLGTELILKLEYKALSGPVKDLAWDAESKRIIAVGEGRDKFGSVFLIDGGSSAGTVEGHSKSINAVAMNRQRPFRAITGSDDAQLGWYNGTPYKVGNGALPSDTLPVSDTLLFFSSPRPSRNTRASCNPSPFPLKAPTPSPPAQTASSSSSTASPALSSLTSPHLLKMRIKAPSTASNSTRKKKMSLLLRALMGF